MKKALPWIVIAAAAVVIGVLLFKPASQPASSGAAHKVNVPESSGTSSTGGSRQKIQTAGKPVFIEFYTPT